MPRFVCKCDLINPTRLPKLDGSTPASLLRGDTITIGAPDSETLTEVERDLRASFGGVLIPANHPEAKQVCVEVEFNRAKSAKVAELLARMGCASVAEAREARADFAAEKAKEERKTRRAAALKTGAFDSDMDELFKTLAASPPPAPKPSILSRLFTTKPAKKV